MHATIALVETDASIGIAFVYGAQYVFAARHLFSKPEDVHNASFTIKHGDIYTTLSPQRRNAVAAPLDGLLDCILIELSPEEVSYGTALVDPFVSHEDLTSLTSVWWNSEETRFEEATGRGTWKDGSVVFEHDLFASPGTSGACLLDSNGKLAGMTIGGNGVRALAIAAGALKSFATSTISIWARFKDASAILDLSPKLASPELQASQYDMLTRTLAGMTKAGAILIAKDLRVANLLATPEVWKSNCKLPHGFEPYGRRGHLQRFATSIPQHIRESRRALDYLLKNDSKDAVQFQNEVPNRLATPSKTECYYRHRAGWANPDDTAGSNGQHRVVVLWDVPGKKAVRWWYCRDEYGTGNSARNTHRYHRAAWIEF